MNWFPEERIFFTLSKAIQKVPAICALFASMPRVIKRKKKFPASM